MAWLQWLQQRILTSELFLFCTEGPESSVQILLLRVNSQLLKINCNLLQMQIKTLKQKSSWTKLLLVSSDQGHKSPSLISSFSPQPVQKRSLIFDPDKEKVVKFGHVKTVEIEPN